MYDIIVSGAGPIGSYLSYLFSKKGYKTLLLEKQNKIVSSPCSGLVSEKLWTFIPFRKDMIENRVHCARLHFNKRIIFLKGHGTEAFVINRKKLNLYLIKRARKNGTEILTGHRTISFQETPSHVTVYVKSRRGLKNFKSKVLAGCDGPLSVTRQTMGIKNPKFFQGLFFYAPGDHDDFLDLYFKTGYFGWKIPRGNKTEYGLFAGIDKPVKRYFRRFCRELNIHPEKIKSGLIPYGLLSRTISERVFLCGDAASQVKPYTGGGLIYSLTSALLASRTINPDKPDLKAYENVWRKKLKKEILTGLLLKDLYFLPNSLLYIMLKLVENKKNLHMDSPSTLFSF